MHLSRLPLLFLAMPALSGCVAAVAVSAASLAVQGAQGHPASNADLRPNARDACSAKAAQYGDVHIIDVEQHRVDKIIVWGTVDDGRKTRSFQCDFKTEITGFRLRDIKSPPAQ